MALHLVPDSAANRALCRCSLIIAAQVDGLSGVVWKLQTVLPNGACGVGAATHVGM
jgi:hypothetical protein